MVSLIDRRHAPPGIGTVQRVFRSLALQGHHELRLAVAEITENGIGKLSIDFNEPFAGNGVPLAAICRAGVAEQRAEEIGQEVGKDLLFLERISTTGRNQFRPMRQLRAEPRHMGGQLECHQVRTENVGTKQRFGFNRHGRPSPGIGQRHPFPRNIAAESTILPRSRGHVHVFGVGARPSDSALPFPIRQGQILSDSKLVHRPLPLMPVERISLLILNDGVSDASHGIGLECLEFSEREIGEKLVLGSTVGSISEGHRVVLDCPGFPPAQSYHIFPGKQPKTAFSRIALHSDAGLMIIVGSVLPR